MVITTPRKPHDECFDPLVSLLSLAPLSASGSLHGTFPLEVVASSRKDRTEGDRQREEGKIRDRGGSVTGSLWGCTEEDGKGAGG